MIIAMLLGPIFGLALGMVDGDTNLLRKAGSAEAVGAALVVAIGWFVGTLHSQLPMTAELLSRTRPTLLDLAIALAGGAAGAYAVVSPRVSVGAVGVAIATALVPPLATCGICLSRGLTLQAGGAFVLFATNLVAIQCAASAVLFLFGFHKVTQRDPDDRGFIRRMALDGALFFLLAVFLYFQFAATVNEQAFKKTTESQLARGLSKIPGAVLAEVRYAPQEASDVVVALVRAPNSITPEQTGVLETALVPRKDRPIKLHVRTQITKETTTDGYLHEIDPGAVPPDELGSSIPREAPREDLPNDDRSSVD